MFDYDRIKTENYSSYVKTILAGEEATRRKTTISFTKPCFSKTSVSPRSEMQPKRSMVKRLLYIFFVVLHFESLVFQLPFFY